MSRSLAEPMPGIPTPPQVRVSGPDNGRARTTRSSLRRQAAVSPVATAGFGGLSQQTSDRTPRSPTAAAAAALISASNRAPRSQKVVVPLRAISSEASIAERYASSGVMFIQYEIG